ncbi:uncharacterized protein LOC112343723 [Selaginella moellendorffii]|uniref:uncharacterized protein LOC112343723 n=1 Tax=Selaginella moellendorffii TaxID=88036 RepID=UPI000D1CD529|nr:uncharacterized protein LOC112343723 [Selaginella moellendorffii]|eukprot:XP_024523476.1 uncharacterized protein LOC112343723 [Selaginella moellendorffii]
MLSAAEKRLLALGLSFIPNPVPLTAKKIMECLDDFQCSVRLRNSFKDSNSLIPEFRVPNPNFDPPPASWHMESRVARIREHLLQRLSCCKRPRSFLRGWRRDAVLALRHDHSIVIKPADKNLGVVVLDRTWYIQEAMRQLNDPLVYKRVESIPHQPMHERLLELLLKYKSCSWLDKNTAKYLITLPSPPRKACLLYFLPKIHKQPIRGRPIASYVGYIWEPLAKWLHRQLFGILLQQETFLMDSHTLLHDLHKQQLPKDCLLFTFDVESLYPSISTREGLYRLHKFVYRNFGDSMQARFIMAAAGLILEHNYVEFDGSYFLQIRGTAMGSNFAVVYACLFLCSLEDEFKATSSKWPIYLKRYIDDGVGIWDGSKESLECWLASYGSLCNSIKITSVISFESMDILDIHFFKGPRFEKCRCLDSTTFQKPLNAYQYLPWNSTHPRHQKIAFIRAELRRYLLRESNPESFCAIRKLFYTRLHARGYPRAFLIEAFRTIHYTDRDNVLYSPSRKSSSNSLQAPLIFKLPYTLHSAALDVGNTLNPKQVISEVPSDSLLRVITCWTRSPNLASHLVSARLPPYG